MIANPERTQLISSMGWVDHDFLWRYDVRASTPERIPLGTGARYLSLHSSGSGRFSVVHHFDGGRIEVTLHSFSDPGKILGRALVNSGEKRVEGDAAAWGDVPLLYVVSLTFEPWKDFVLLRMVPSTGLVDVQRLEWYDETFDKGYQGVIEVLELPGEECALVSVQRSSELILHDLATGKKKSSLDLGGRGGNPNLQLGKGGAEIWASDYDTMVVVRREDWRVGRSARVQGALVGTQQFIGDYSFSPDDDSCVVARPFSGDVVGIDGATLKVKGTAKLGRQPLEVVALPHGEVVARDWQTGDPLRGKLKRSWFVG